jgi:hypothetical protein
MDQIASGEIGTTGDQAATGPAPTLLAGLAHAMHMALAHERERIDKMVAEDARDHAEKARARAAIEANELRRLADDEVREIEAWAAREIKRIRREAGRRTRERRADMESFLQRHRAIIETEIAGLDSAVADYSASLAHFVENLVATGNPGEIARRADTLPAPPDLDAVRAQARARAVAAYDRVDDAPPAGGIAAAADAPDSTSDPGVAVMDPEADGRRDLPLAVDPLQVSEDEPVGPAEPVKNDEEAADANGQPSGAFRFFRALVPWSTASTVPHAKETDARRS